MPADSPIVILGSHRSGTSAVAGLLASAGLELGDVLVPSPDNPKGYFESKAVVDANRRLLASMGRDWTFPPSRLANDLDLTPLSNAISGLRASGNVWGFKDPRTLFLLPAWAEVIPSFRFLGVYRPTTDIARSLVRRDGVTPEVARKIALRYNERLWRIHEQLRFPIVRYGVHSDVLLERIATIANSIGLDLERSAAQQFLDEARESLESETGSLADAYLAEQSEHPIGNVDVYEAARVIDLDRHRSYHHVTESPSYVGVAHTRRTRSLWSLAVKAQSVIGTVLVVAPDGSPMTEPLVGTNPGHIVRTDPAGLSTIDQAASPSHVVAVDVVDRIKPAELADFLVQLDRLTGPDAVLAFDGLIVDGLRVPTERYMRRIDTTASRLEQPYLHHLNEVEAVILDTSWLIGHLGVDIDDQTRVNVTLVKDAAMRASGQISSSELREESVRIAACSVEIARIHGMSSSGPEEMLESLSRSIVTERASSEQTVARITAERDDARTTVGELKEGLTALKRTATSRAIAIEERDAQIEAATSERDAIELSLVDATTQLDSLNDKTLVTEQKLTSTEQKLTSTEQKLTSTEQKLTSTEQKLTSTEQRYEQLRSRRIVRIALAVVKPLRPFFQWARGHRSGPATGHDAIPAEATERTGRRPSPRDVRSAILRARPGDGPSNGPLVSMVVLTRNGKHHLERLFDGLQKRTSYRSFEVIVIDNASGDGTGSLLHDDWGFPLRVIRNERNTSFSEGCNQGLAVASGEFILLLNNDVDPINPGWLGAMVDGSATDSSLGAVGALLVYPKTPPNSEQSALDYELTIQHRGIAFRWQSGMPLAYNLGKGEDPTSLGLVETVEVPGVTAACLLMRTAVLRSLGGLDERFIYGFEDVDLNLRIREQGLDIAVIGRAALFHHEFGTQAIHGGQRQRAYRGANHQYFAEKWSPRLSRTLRLDSIAGGGMAWNGIDSRRVAITVTKDDPAGGWGDWHTAHELGDAFAATGWDVIYLEAFEDRWRHIPDDVDLVISLLDGFDATLAPEGAITVAWIRNWTDRWIERPWTASFDVLVPSSQVSADLLQSAGLNVAGILPLATNPERFHPIDADVLYEADYTFTGSNWGVGRSLFSDLDVAPGERFSLFGTGWDSVGRAARYWRGPVPYDDLPLVYNSAKVVLDDTAGHTLPYGAVNSRVFDALACGSLVITNNILGSEEIFDGLLPSYGDRAELRSLLDTYLADEESREATAADLQRIVLSRHTYATRVEQFIDLVGDRLRAPRVALKIGPPNHDVAEHWGDTHFARAFAESLERLGCTTSIDILPEWDLLGSQSTDIVVHLRGLVPYVPKPGQFNVLWIISHPEDVPDYECERYDLVLVASRVHADILRQRLNVPVAPFLQATAFGTPHAPDETAEEHPETDRPDPDVLFVGNSRGVLRHGVDWSLKRDIPLSIYGSGWESLIDESHVVAEHLPNGDLAAAYRSAGIVLNDHWPDMRDGGFISNRIFDVLASGGFVISDTVTGIEDVFEDTVPTYRDAEELEQLIKYFQEHPNERIALAERGHDIVTSDHGFDKRADQFLSLVLPLLASRPQTVESTPISGS